MVRNLMNEASQDSGHQRETTQVCVVEAEQQAVSLVQLWPFVDRVFLRNLLQDGRARVNGETSSARRRLRAGDVVLVALPDQLADLPRYQEPEREPEFVVIHEDAEVLVVDKPAGLHSVPDRGGKYLGVQGHVQSGREGVELRALPPLTPPLREDLAKRQVYKSSLTAFLQLRKS